MSALTEARAAVGGLSRPSKMPCWSYNIPAVVCKVGAALRKILGSTCADCYALKGRYMFPNVQAALHRRLESISRDDWPDNMAIAINNAPFFRWHDSGDIQDTNHLTKIIKVAELTPNTRHWLPTREKALIKAYLKSGAFPENLTVRVSATMIDGKPPEVVCDWNRTLPTSTVHTADAIGYECPAPKQGNKCGDYRACWDRDVKNVSYARH